VAGHSGVAAAQLGAAAVGDGEEGGKQGGDEERRRERRDKDKTWKLSALKTVPTSLSQRTQCSGRPPWKENEGRDGTEIDSLIYFAAGPPARLGS
jgi:hypothetical protein